MKLIKQGEHKSLTPKGTRPNRIYGNIKQGNDLFEVEGNTYITAYLATAKQRIMVCLHGDGRFDISWGLTDQVSETILEGTLFGNERNITRCTLNGEEKGHENLSR